MELGGNGKLEEFFKRYDLCDESQNVRYSTAACQFYRKWLLSMAQGQTFTESAPLYEEGRKQVQVDSNAKDGADEGSLKQNDPADPNSQVQKSDEMEQLKQQANAALKAGIGYIYWGASKVKQKSDEVGLSQKMLDAKEYTKSKAEEYKVQERANYAGNKIKSAANTTVTYTKETTNSVIQHYQNGTLGEVTQQKAQATGSYVKEQSNRLYHKLAKTQSSGANGQAAASPSNDEGTNENTEIKIEGEAQMKSDQNK